MKKKKQKKNILHFPKVFILKCNDVELNLSFKY